MLLMPTLLEQSHSWRNKTLSLCMELKQIKRGTHLVDDGQGKCCFVGDLSWEQMQ